MTKKSTNSYISNRGNGTVNISAGRGYIKKCVGCDSEIFLYNNEKYCSDKCELNYVKRQLKEARRIHEPLEMIAGTKYEQGVIVEIYERKSQHAKRRAMTLRRIGHKIVDVHRIGKFKMENSKWVDASMVVYSLDPDEELLSVENSQSG